MGNVKSPGFETKKVQIFKNFLQSVTTPAREAVLTRSPPLPPLSKDILSSTSSAASMAAMMLMSIHLQHVQSYTNNIFNHAFLHNIEGVQGASYFGTTKPVNPNPRIQLSVRPCV